jgi:hypothetical protein
VVDVTSEQAAERAAEHQPEGTDPGRTDDAHRHDLEERVHVDLPRVRAEDMVTSQQVTPPQDPSGGRDTEQDFVLRHAGF